MKFRWLILPLIAGLSVIPASNAVSASTTNLANGNRVEPSQAVGCSGNACIFLGTPSGGTVTVRGCAWKTTFTGWIHISGPNNLSKDSASGSWTKTSHYCTGTDKYFEVKTPAVVGKYCSTSYKSSGEYYGTACKSVL